MIIAGVLCYLLIKEKKDAYVSDEEVAEIKIEEQRSV